MDEEIANTCALCKKIIKKGETIHWSRWYSPLGRKRPFHEECLRDLEDLFLEDRHVFSILAMIILAGISSSFAYFVQWEKGELGYAPIGGWIFWPSLILGLVFLGAAAYMVWHGSRVVSHPTVKRWKKKQEQKR